MALWNVYTEFFYWGFLGFVNLLVSIIVYRSTLAERKKKLTSEFELTTRPARYTGISFPSFFTYISLFTGALNAGGAFLRFKRIQFLDIPTPSWLYQFASIGLARMRGTTVEAVSEDVIRLLDAEWLVAMNDWTSLFLGLTFFAAACFNFATVRQLRMRDRMEQQVLLPKPSPTKSKSSHSNTPTHTRSQTWHVNMREDTFVNGNREEGRSFVRRGTVKEFSK